jgi:hypothetical protein
MPDLRSELMKLENLTFDDDVSSEPSPITPAPDKVNISKLLWETIKVNPNKNSQQIANIMNGGSMVGIATRLKQMLDRGILSRTVGADDFYVYQALGTVYPAHSKAESIAKAQAVRLEKKAKRDKQRKYNATYKAKRRASVTTEVAPASRETTPLKATDAEQLVNQMTIGMAKAVYLELKKVFES